MASTAVAAVLLLLLVAAGAGADGGTVTPLNQLLFWDNGSTFETVPLASAVVIDTGRIGFVTTCEKGTKDFLFPVADVYVVPAGSVHLGDKLVDVAGTPNPIAGATDGSFVDELIGTTMSSAKEHSAGRIPIGTYAVVYDECQDGVLDENDAVFDPAFTVSATADVPPLDLTGFKAHAGDTTGTLESLLKMVKGVKFLADHKAELECAGDALQAAAAGEVTEELTGCLTDLAFDKAEEKIIDLIKEKSGLVDPFEGAENYVENAIKHAAAITADPPDPGYAQPSLLLPAPPFPAPTQDPLLRRLVAAENAIGNEDALFSAMLHSLERYQGAGQDHAGDPALMHARELENDAKLLAQQLPATNDALTALAGAAAADPVLPNSGREWQAMRDQLVTSGFGADHIRQLRNDGLSDADIQTVEAEIIGQPVTGTEAADLQTALTAVTGANTDLAASAQALATTMAGVVSQLEGDPAVAASAPVADAGGPYTGTEGTPLALDGSSSAANGGHSITDYSWDTNDDGVFGDATGASPTLTFDHPYTGTVALRITDDAGQTNVAYAHVSVAAAGQPPSFTSVAPTGAQQSVRIGSALTFSVAGANPATVTWTVDAFPLASGSPSFVYMPGVGDVGPHLVTATATTPDGSTAQSWQVAVLAPDADNDGWDANIDCNDADHAVNPGATEIPGNGKDDDCNPGTSDIVGAPTAAFSVANAFVGVAAQFTDHSTDDGTIVDRSWDFGDGSTSTDTNPTHTYTAAGTYTVTLTVTDNDHISTTVTKSLAVTAAPPGTPPVASFDPESGTGTNVALKEAGASVAAFSSAADANYAPDAMIDGVDDFFGWATGGLGGQFATIRLAGGPRLIDRIQIRGRSSCCLQQRPQQFAVDVSTDGTTFTQVLQASASNVGDLQTFTLPQPALASYVRYRPLSDWGDCCNIATAQFTALTGQIGNATVTFRNTSTDAENDIVASTWNFGDGNPLSHEASPTHTYAAAGTYHVTLTELDATGRSSTTSLDQTVVRAPHPVILGDDSGTTSQPVGFDGTSSVAGDAPILLYLWNWGDGTVSSGQNATHQYATDGDYAVKLDVVDAHGVTAEATQAVSIHAHAGSGSAAVQWATGFPYNAFSGCCGPYGMAWSPSGDLYVVDNADGFLYRFDPHGGVADAAHRVGSTSFPGNDTGLVFDAQGRLWVGRINMGDVAQLDPADGSVLRTIAAPCPLSLAVDPISGDLFTTACTGGIYRIAGQDGAAPQVSLYASPGVTQIAFASDGTLYALSGSAALQIDGTSAAAPGHVSLLVAGGLPGSDGLAVSSSGFPGLPPQLFLDGHDGTVTHVDPVGYPAAVDDLYVGGTRGSTLTIGPDGCLYAGQLTTIIKLTNANGDCGLQSASPAPQLSLAPAVVTPQHTVGGTAAVRAELLGSAAQPGVEVTFTVTGANPQTAIGTTDASGAASFAYTAAAPGDDTITATATVDGRSLTSNVAAVHWDVAASAPPIAFFDPQGRGRDVALLESGATVVDVSSFFPGWSPDVMLNYSPDDFPDAWATGDGQLTGQWVKIALPATYQLDGFRVMPRVDGAGQRVHVFEVDVSTTGTADSDFTTAVHATARDEGTLQEFVLDRPVLAHYIRYRPLSRWGTGCCISTSQFKAMSGQFGDATARFQNLSTGAQTYAWDFGDGSQAATENPTHTFPGPGTYHVTLTAANAAGSASYSTDYTVERAPSGDFSFSPSLPNEGQSVSFTSTPTGADGAAIVRATWDFGDGSGQLVGPLSPTHVYGDNGTYTVSETVVDSNDTKTTVEHVVTVANVPPTATPPASVPTFEDRPMSFGFAVSDAGSNDQLHCHWDFGDGSAGDLPCGSFSHTYTTLGTDHATVTVTDKDGASSTASTDIVVQRRAQTGYAATDFVRGFPQPGFGISPVGLAFDSGDNLYADDYATGFLYKFGPQGGAVGDATRLGSAPLGCGTAGLAFSKTGRLYLARQCNNDVVEVDPATGQVLREVVGGLPCATGLATDPLSGDLFVTTAGCAAPVYRIQHVEDGGTPSADVYGSYGAVDGITFAPDGTMYLEAGGQPLAVAGTNASTPGAVLHTYPALNQMDGIAVAQSGGQSSPPFIFANRNDGTITKVDLTTATPTLTDIFIGGTRGDFVAVGPDGCLYATQSATIVRVTNADGTCTLAGTSVVPQLGLSPAHADLFHGSTASIKATITNVATPAGTVVSFTVTGANPQTGMATVGDDGAATFTYTGSNVGDDSITATAVATGVQLTSNVATVSWQNRAPNASDSSVTVSAGSASTVTPTASDPDGDALTYTVVSQPAHGTLDGSAANLTYTPAAGYTGPDSFTFRANDGRADSNLATVSIDVLAPDLCTVPAASPGGIFLTGHDPDFHSQNNENEAGAEHILQRAVAFVSNGKPSPRILLVTGTSSPGGGFLDSRTGVTRSGFTFDVARAGPADAQTLDLSTVDFSQYDVIIVASDFGGWLSQAELDVLDARSLDIMRFVDGGGGLVALAESRLQNRFAFLPFVVTSRPNNVSEIGNTVTNVGAALGITNDDINGNASHNVFVGDAGMFVIDHQPDGEILTLAERGARVGATGLCEPPPPVLTNHPPVAQDQMVSTDEETPVDVTATANDPDGDALTYAVAGSPAHGTLTGAAPSLTYTPNAGFTGDDTFTFTASDGTAISNVATVTIHVRAVDHPPLCADASATTSEDTPLDGAVSCNDVDPGQSLAYALVHDAAHGSATVAADGTFHYVPVADFHGTDSFTFVANDGVAASNTGTVTIDVTEVNDPPAAVDDVVTTREDTAATVDVLANDTPGPQDESGQTLTIDTVGAPAHGTASIDGAKIVYHPFADYNGSDTFDYRICDDGTSGGAADPKCARAQVTVDVTAVNDPPVAVDDGAATTQDMPVAVDVLANDSTGPANEQDQHLAIATVTKPAHGSAGVVGDRIVYTPDADFTGADTFSYRVCDDGTTAGVPDPQCGTAQVTVDVTPVNRPPVAADDSATTREDSPVTVDVLANDTPGPPSESGQKLSIVSVDPPQHGTASIEAGRIAYRPAAGYNGPDTFGYRVCDDGTTAGVPDPKCADATVRIDVTPVNHPPTVDDGAVSVDEDAPPVSIDLATLAHDLETPSTGLTYTIVDRPAKGTLVLNGSTATYDSNDNANGADSFTFRVTDTGDPAGCGTQSEHCDVPSSAVGTVHIAIKPVNDAPTISLDPAGPVSEGAAPITITAHAFDVEATDGEGEVLTYSWTSDVGSIVPHGTTAKFSADDGPAVAHVTVTVSDGELTASSTEDVQIRNVPPTVDAGPDQTQFWGLPVVFHGSVSDPSAADAAAGLAPTWTLETQIGDDVEHGTQATETYSTPGTYSARLDATDKDGGHGSGTAHAAVLRRTSSLAWAGPTAATYGFAVLAAKLTDTVDAPTARLAGHAVTFTVGGRTYTGTTDATGLAIVMPTLPVPTGPVTATFAGDALYAPSTAAAVLTVASSSGKITAGSVSSADFGRGGFNVQSDGAGIKGEFQWQKPGLNFHAHTLTALGISPDRTTGWFAGVGDDGRPFVAYVEDRGEPGRNDIFRLWIAGVLETPADGKISGGNVQIHG